MPDRLARDGSGELSVQANGGRGWQIDKRSHELRGLREVRRKKVRTSARAKTVVTRAHAKINLDLRVGAKRPDGYHELRTVFQAIDLHDRIVCSRRRGPFTLRSGAMGMPLDDQNLVWRAAAALWQGLQRDGELQDVSITIEKRIPMAAGLGGGSADAAATLLALARLWGARVEASALHELAARLGADVPFFLTGGTALGLGRGDQIYPLRDIARTWVVLLLPEFGVSTLDAFRWYDEAEHESHGARPPSANQPELWPLHPASLTNDLEEPIGRRHPEIAVATALLRSCGALAAGMSGSGSAMFGLFDTRVGAAAAALRMKRSGRRVILSRTLTYDEYARLARPMLPRGQ